MIGKIAGRAIEILRDGWLVVGISAVLLLGLEVAYRGQAEMRRVIRGDDGAIPENHPYADEAWWEEWVRGEGLSMNRYDPYRARWSLPKSGPYLNIDSLGRRRTVQPALDSSDVRYRIFLLGGSVMFGYTARDEWTIPSQLASLIAEAGIRGVEVVNLGQSTFNATQGMITLALALRDGEVPDAVVFLDGVNDVIPVFQGVDAGGIVNQELMAQVVRRDPPTLADQLLQKLKFVGRLKRAVDETTGEDSISTAPDPDEVCPEVADTYFGAVSVAETLGDGYGFPTFFFWQPMLSSAGKELTDFERSLLGEPGWRALVARCTEAVGERARARESNAFEELTHVFDDASGTVFLDDYGHVTEAANRRIARAIWERIEPTLRRSLESGP